MMTASTAMPRRHRTLRCRWASYAADCRGERIVRVATIVAVFATTSFLLHRSLSRQSTSGTTQIGMQCVQHPTHGMLLRSDALKYLYLADGKSAPIDASKVGDEGDRKTLHLAVAYDYREPAFLGVPFATYSVVRMQLLDNSGALLPLDQRAASVAVSSALVHSHPKIAQAIRGGTPALRISWGRSVALLLCIVMGILALCGAVSIVADCVLLRFATDFVIALRSRKICWICGYHVHDLPQCPECGHESAHSRVSEIVPPHISNRQA